MDENLREKIRSLAETNGLDPEELEAALMADSVPLELQEAMTVVLGDVGRFTQALDELKK